MTPFLIVFMLGALLGALCVYRYRHHVRRQRAQMFRTEVAALRAVQRLHLAAWRGYVLMSEEARRLRDAG